MCHCQGMTGLSCKKCEKSADMNVLKLKNQRKYVIIRKLIKN